MLRPWSLFSFLFCSVFLIGNLHSQSAGKESTKAGIALVKPQPWAKDNEATVLEFQGFTDRTASGATGAGYYEFTGKTGTKRQVQASKVVKLVVFADPTQIKEMITPEERQKVLSSITEIKDTIVKYPSTRTYLEPSVKSLEAEVAKFDAGQIKTKGAWVARDSYQKDQASNLANLLKSDVVQAKPASSFDIVNDPKYIALKEMSASNPGVKTILQEITETHGKRVREEKRKELLATLATPSLSLAEAQSAVTQLTSLKPEEDPTSAAFVKSWTTASATAKEVTDLAKPLITKLETELGKAQVDNASPELSADLDRELSALRQKTTVFIATKPAPQLVSEASQAMAVADSGATFKALKPLFEQKQFLQAKDTLDHFDRQTHLIGPQTERVVAGLQRYVAGRIEEFSRLREEAKLLAGSNKPAEALVKYEAAYEVIPDNEVNTEITKLKGNAPAQ